jgi:hypothetical protein
MLARESPACSGRRSLRRALLSATLTRLSGVSELRIDEVTLDELPVLVVAKDGDPGEAAGAAFSELEAALSSLRGRRFYGYYEPSEKRYFACVVSHDDDVSDLDRRTLPGGAYARTRLRGEPPELYARIGETFDRIAKSVAADSTRPWLEDYRSENEVDVLVPVLASER